MNGIEAIQAMLEKKTVMYNFADEFLALDNWLYAGNLTFEELYNSSIEYDDYDFKALKFKVLAPEEVDYSHDMHTLFNNDDFYEPSDVDRESTSFKAWRFGQTRVYRDFSTQDKAVFHDLVMSQDYTVTKEIVADFCNYFDVKPTLEPTTDKYANYCFINNKDQKSSFVYNSVLDLNYLFLIYIYSVLKYGKFN